MAGSIKIGNVVEHNVTGQKGIVTNFYLTSYIVEFITAPDTPFKWDTKIIAVADMEENYKKIATLSPDDISLRDFPKGTHGVTSR